MIDSALNDLSALNNAEIVNLEFLLPMPKAIFKHIDVAIAGLGYAFDIFMQRIVK